MESLLATDNPHLTDLSAPPLLLVPVPMPNPAPWTDTASRRADRPGVGVTPWAVGLLSLVICWPLGIPALITTGLARAAGNRSAAAVQADELYEAARFLDRSRRYQCVSLACSALGALVVATFLIARFAYLGG